MPTIPPLFRAAFRSNFEAEVCWNLQEAGIPYAEYYEREKIAYTVPARTAHYLPDLLSKSGHLALELKGFLGDVDDRIKYIHFRDSHPEIELRFVLQRRGVKIYKGSKTTQEQWLESKGFKVAIGSIPTAWVQELAH